MNQAILYGLLSGLSLVLGAALGIFFSFKRKIIAAFMAFGSGVMICALTFGLMQKAFEHGGFDAIIIGFLLGGLVFIGVDYLLHYFGGRKHKYHQIIDSKKDTSGALITTGAILDGIPESIALGISIFAGQGLGILMLAAIFLSNFPESISSVNGLRKEGFSKTKIFWLWFSVGITTALIVVSSYLFLRNLDFNTLGILESFAAGAILAMLADSMIPEAYKEGGFAVAILTIFGFLSAFIISRF